MVLRYILVAGLAIVIYAMAMAMERNLTREAQVMIGVIVAVAIPGLVVLELRLQRAATPRRVN